MAHERTGNLTVEELAAAHAAGEIDTVIIGFTDMQGRLVGKRASARLFLEELAQHGAECCNYLLAVDVENNTVDGYAISSWERGYGDMAMMPDLDTLRLTPWMPGTAMVTADLTWLDGTPVNPDPRQVLKRQIQRLADKGLAAYVGTELEFIVFDDSYREAWKKKYTDLTPASDYNIDYALMASTRMEPLLRDIRNSMDAAGMYCEGVKGECNLGQQEIAFRYTDALGTCDNHSLYKNGAKEIADAHGKSLTFMAKYNEREGNSCHIHISVRGNGDGHPDGAPVMADESNGHELSPLGRSFVAGQLAHMRELTLFSAPNVNSYKRFVPGSFAPTTVAWGRDNRTCAIRLVGHGHGLRMENRVPGGDINPYLATAALVAAGIDGMEKGMELEDALVGNAYESDLPKVPHTLDDSLRRWEASDFARSAFGDAVVDHYANMARIELASYSSTVTDWELRRNFERF